MKRYKCRRAPNCKPKAQLQKTTKTKGNLVDGVNILDNMSEWQLFYQLKGIFHSIESNMSQTHTEPYLGLWHKDLANQPSFSLVPKIV